MKKLLLIFSFCFTLLSSYAQDNNELKNDGGRLEAYKIAFLTKKLNLSPEEAQRFWPIYNKYEGEIRSARTEFRQKKGNEIEIEERILNIRKKYNNEFSKALTTEKVNTLFRSEKEFGNIVQKEMMERRQLQNRGNRNKD
ncbi:MAG TPA: hypothetical protein VM012_07860 [Flavitalea sp.]|nr:hypothetical protein [Flavitalea sp.]